MLVDCLEQHLGRHGGDTCYAKDNERVENVKSTSHHTACIVGPSGSMHVAWRHACGLAACMWLGGMHVAEAKMARDTPAAGTLGCSGHAASGDHGW